MSRRAKITVTLRDGTLFRTFRDNPVLSMKMEPKLEVSLVRPDQVSGGKKIGEVLSKPGGDRAPVWDHTLPPEDFEIGEQLHLKVLDKHHWPKKDVVIGQGYVTLRQEMVTGRQPVELKVQVHKIGARAGTEPEHTGDIQVGLHLQKLDGQQVTAQPSSDSQSVDGRNRLSAFLSLPGGEASSSVTLDSTQSEREQRLLRAGLDSRQIGGEDRRGVSTSFGPLASLTEHPQDEAGRRAQLVAVHYWERGVRSRKHPVLCTAGVQRWLKTFFCRSGCCRGEDRPKAFSRSSSKELLATEPTPKIGEE